MKRRYGPELSDYRGFPLCLNRTNYSTDEEEFGEELDTGFIEPKSIVITPGLEIGHFEKDSR